MTPSLSLPGDPLPIDAVLPDILSSLDAQPNLVLEAPPGAGKTTRVPLALLSGSWRGDAKIMVLEPRRIAARAAARRLASLLGEEVGGTVGYRMRLDTRVSAKTRIEVVTEGVFTRLIQDDPALEGVACVVLDEFHERSIDADLALALALDAQAGLRPDLRLIAMSATLDGIAVSGLMEAPVVASLGRAYPVDLRWREEKPGERVEDRMASVIREALRAEPAGDVLAFLPGQGEIRRTAERLADLPADVLIVPLFGDLTMEAQDQAIRPAPAGKRKVVLATAIAETSLTIEGVRVVVDSGLARVARFDPRTGMTRLETERASQATAEQRRGRAGRLGPGVCYRLWAEAGHRARAQFPTPELADADLAPLVLDLALWGVTDPATLRWLTVPPTGAVAMARALLADLGTLDDEGRITTHGRAVSRLGAHPRLAHMMLAGAAHGWLREATAMAAVLGERDLLIGQGGARDADLAERVALALGNGTASNLDRATLDRVRRTAKNWAERLEKNATKPAGPADLGLLLALAYPDRIAQRRGEGGYRLANGRGAVFRAGDPLATQAFVAIADLDDSGRDATIRLALPVSLAALEDGFADRIRTVEAIEWSSRDRAVQARRQRRLGALVLSDAALGSPPAEAVQAAMIAGIRELGLTALPWSKELAAFRARIAFLAAMGAPDGPWPDVSDKALLKTLPEWLGGYLSGVTRAEHLSRIDLSSAVRGLLDWQRAKALDELAPTHVTVPSGSRVPIDYDAGEVPVLAVRLQEMFGAKETPAIVAGRVPLLLHLLSPALRPVQVTRDLAGFWADSYKAVRADLRGRYPKHSWPDDPLAAIPTNRTKKAMERSQKSS